MALEQLVKAREVLVMLATAVAGHEAEPWAAIEEAHQLLNTATNKNESGENEAIETPTDDDAAGELDSADLAQTPDGPSERSLPHAVQAPASVQAQAPRAAPAPSTRTPAGDSPWAPAQPSPPLAQAPVPRAQGSPNTPPPPKRAAKPVAAPDHKAADAPPRSEDGHAGFNPLPFGQSANAATPPAAPAAKTYTPQKHSGTIAMPAFRDPSDSPTPFGTNENTEGLPLHLLSLGVEGHAAMSAECDVFPDHIDEILDRYAIRGPAEKRSVDAHYLGLTRKTPNLFQKWQQAYEATEKRLRGG